MNVTRLIMLFVTSALLAATSALAQAPAAPRLLGATLKATVIAKPGDAATVQARVVQPDFALLDGFARAHLATGERGRFVIDLFPGLDVEAEVIAAETRPSGTTLFARLVDVELGSAVFTLEAGVLTASVDFPAGNYTIERQADGNYQVTRKAAHLYAPEVPPRQVFGSKRETQTFSDPSPSVAPDVPADSGRLIDIMVIWTPAAESAAGGLAAMQSLAQASVDNANLTYLNSGIAHRLRLVHRQQFAYTERTTCAGGGTAFDCALDDVTFTGDGYLDAVHALRDTHGADMVAFLISDNSFCGLAWITSTAAYAFSVTAWNCAVGNKSFVHEVGHNMGAHHDPYVAPGPGAYAYSHGIVNLAARWRTVMSYNNECVATPPGTSCTRIQYFSNPKLTYGGASLGDASVRNNAHTLNKTAKAIAAFRPTSALHPVPQRFVDVPTSHQFYGHIEFFAQAGITSGCGAGLFCPADVVTRRQMAGFLERSMRASNWVAPPTSGYFTDVPPGSLFANDIDQLRLDGITTGCGSNVYCPDLPVTRGEMAVFLLRARCGSSYVPTTGPQVFADVPPGHPFQAFIQKIYALGITSGCATGPLRYCPGNSITREQMAVFVERSYPYLTPTEACAL